MFNESYSQVSADTTKLNNKLRGHQGGKLNTSARVVQLTVENSFKDHNSFWANFFICTVVITVCVLVRETFVR